MNLFIMNLFIMNLFIMKLFIMKLFIMKFSYHEINYHETVSDREIFWNNYCSIKKLGQIERPLYERVYKEETWVNRVIAL